jgi:hypothetical protein
MRKLLRDLAADGLDMSGWTIKKTNGNHYRLAGPNGELVFASSTPGPSARTALTGEVRRAIRVAGRNGGTPGPAPGLAAPAPIKRTAPGLSDGRPRARKPSAIIQTRPDDRPPTPIHCQDWRGVLRQFRDRMWGRPRMQGGRA